MQLRRSETKECYSHTTSNVLLLIKKVEQWSINLLSAHSGAVAIWTWSRKWCLLLVWSVDCIGMEQVPPSEVVRDSSYYWLKMWSNTHTTHLGSGEMKPCDHMFLVVYLPVMACFFSIIFYWKCKLALACSKFLHWTDSQ